MSEDICQICNVFKSDHDYEHLARTCYPQKIRHLESRLLAAQARENELKRLMCFACHVTPQDRLLNRNGTVKEVWQEPEFPCG